MPRPLVGGGGGGGSYLSAEVQSVYFTTPADWARVFGMTRLEIEPWSLGPLVNTLLKYNWLNSEFFLLLEWLPHQVSHCLHIDGGYRRIVKLIAFPRVLLCGMQTALFRFWTLVVRSIFDDFNLHHEQWLYRLISSRHLTCQVCGQQCYSSNVIPVLSVCSVHHASPLSKISI